MTRTGGGSYFKLLLPTPFAASTVGFNADNQQTLWNGLSNIFDANGNLTCTGSSSSGSCTGAQSQALAWDARNRLVNAAGSPSLGGSAETYVYDGLSRRQSVTNATAATMASYLYRGLDPVQINTVNTATNATVDSTKVFLGLGLDEHIQVNGSSASTTGEAAVVALSYGTTGAAAGAVGSFAGGGSSSQIQNGAIAGALAPLLSGEAFVAAAADAFGAETGLAVDGLLNASSATIEAGLNQSLKALQPGNSSCP